MAQQSSLDTTSFICGLLAGIAVLLTADYFFDPPAKQTSAQGGLLTIYGVDVTNVLHEEYCFYVTVPNSLPLIDRIQLFADKVSQFEFKHRPITVMGIELRDGKQIATIDLHDSQPLPNTDDASWYARFQGSTGGIITETVLTKSFLQDEYQGQWIDGIEFLYNGKPFYEDQWDHIHLNGTYMRDGTKLLRDGTIEQIYPIYQQFPPS